MVKGKYYIGDPCYLFEESWGKVLEDNNYFNNENSTINGVEVCVGLTAYGDGEYEDNEGFKYPVDSGLIGIMPIKLLEVDRVITEEEIIEKGCGRIIEMEQDFVCTIENGVFRFGDVLINPYKDEYEQDQDFD